MWPSSLCILSNAAEISDVVIKDLKIVEFPNNQIRGGFIPIPTESQF